MKEECFGAPGWKDASRAAHHLLNLHGVPDDVADHLCRRFVHQVFEHQTGKITVQTLKAAQKQDALSTAAIDPEDRATVCYLVSADELVGEGQARHQASFLQPEDGCKGPREENALHGSKGYHTLAWTRQQKEINLAAIKTARWGELAVGGVTIGRVLIADPVESPVGLPLHAGESLNSVEQILSLREMRNETRVTKHRLDTPDPFRDHQQKCPTSQTGP